MKRSFIILYATIFLLGCATSRHIRNGDAMISQQNYERAAREYGAALRNSPNNTRSYTGLQNASDRYIKEQLKKFDELFNSRNYVRAEETMNSILDFIDTYSRFGIKADIPQSYISRSQNISNAMAEFYYRHGLSELNNRNYQSARGHFIKTQELAPNYKNVRTLLQQTETAISNVNAEKYYQSGVRNYQSGNFRSAYRDFDNCLRQVNGYKNAAHLQNNALEKGRVRIGIFEFGNDTRVYGVQGTLHSYVLSDIVNIKSPFVDVLDRQNLSRVMDEIWLSHSESADISSAVKAGRLLGLHYVVFGRVTNVIEEGGQIIPSQMNAYELYFRTVEGEQKPQGRPVSFTLYEGSTTVTFEAQYQIISVETGQIVKSNIVSSKDSDAVSYARYFGEPSLLYMTDPGAASGGTGIGAIIMNVLVNATRVNQDLFSARTNLKTPSELQASIMRNISRQMAREVAGHFD